MLDRQAQIEFILDHYEHPRHKGRLENADVTLTGGNPGCGDIVTIYLKAAGDRADAITFEGSGCTISQAGASIIAEMAQGMPLAEIEQLDHEVMVETMGREVVNTRVRCATLGLGTLQAAIKELRAQRIRAQQT
jgi:nitrogen fixation NifU-like protein